MSTCMTASASAPSVPGRTARCSSACTAVGVRYGSMTTTWAPRCRACLTSVITLIVEYAALTPQSTTRSAPTICSESLPVTCPTVARQPVYAVDTQIERSSRLAPSAWNSGCPAKNCTWPIDPAYEKGRIASPPCSAAMARQRAILFAVVYFSQGMYYVADQVRNLTLKETHGLSPAQVGTFGTIILVPWLIKPIYGLISDAFPLFGRRRKSYFLLTSALATLSGLALWLHGEPTYWSLAIGLFVV